MRAFVALSIVAIGTYAQRPEVKLRVVMMTGARGGSNARARRELDGQPRWSTWRLGFAKGLDQ